MIVAADIRKVVLQISEECGKGASFTAVEVAQLINPVSWEEQLDQVVLVVDSLLQEGKIRSVIDTKTREFRFKKCQAY